MNNWLFHVQEHSNLTNILSRGHIAYAALLLRHDAMMWWCELCESDNRLNTWEVFRDALHEQFRAEILNRRSRDELAMLGVARRLLQSCDLNHAVAFWDCLANAHRLTEIEHKHGNETATTTGSQKGRRQKSRDTQTHAAELL